MTTAAVLKGGRWSRGQWVDRNEWEIAIRQSPAEPGQSSDAVSAGQDPFSLADPPTVTGILKAAGFAGVTFAGVHYGQDTASSAAF